MDAGPELDALVAQRVFGWTNLAERPVFNQMTMTGYRADGHPDVVKCYSTSIAAAWLVVEHLRTNGWGVTLNMYPQPSTVEVALWDGKGFVRETIRATVPLAICRAALNAVEAQALAGES